MSQTILPTYRYLDLDLETLTLVNPTFPSVLLVCSLSRPGGTAGLDTRSTSLNLVGKG